MINKMSSKGFTQQWGRVLHDAHSPPNARPRRCNCIGIARAQQELSKKASASVHQTDELCTQEAELRTNYPRQYAQAGLQQQSSNQYEQPGHQEQLRQVLQLNPCHFGDLVANAPYLLGFSPYSLSVTLDALCDALHTHHRTVVGIVQQRPSILLTPHEPGQVLQQLAAVIGTSSRHAAVSLSKHMQLLALSPQQLQQRLQQLCSIMHWPTHQIQQAVASAGTPAFLQLLSSEPTETADQLSALAHALGTSESSCAAFAQHYPRQLLQRKDPATAILPQLNLLAATAGVTVSVLLQELDQEQNKGFAGLLLYEASWLKQQLRSLDGLLERLLGHKLSGRMLVWLLLRLGTSNMFSSFHRLSETGKNMAALKQVVARHEQWEVELQQATDKELAVVLSADGVAVQRMLFLACTGKAGGCGWSLQECVHLPREEFVRQYGKDEFEHWRATRQTG